MKTTGCACAWAALLGAGVAHWATALREPSEQRIREVVNSCLQDASNTERHALGKLRDANMYTESIRPGQEGGDAVRFIASDAPLDRRTAATSATHSVKRLSADAIGWGVAAVLFELNLNKGQYIDCLFLHQVDGEWRSATGILILR